MVGWYHQLDGHEYDWTNTGSQWMTAKPGVPQSVESQRIGHDLATEQQ